MQAFFARRIMKEPFYERFLFSKRCEELVYAQSEFLSILLLIRLFLTNPYIATDLCPRMTCLYPRVSWVSARLNTKISRGYLEIPSRSHSSVDARKTNEICGRTKVYRRTRRALSSARKRAPGPPNNSRRATRDVYVSRRRDARVRLAVTGTARESSRVYLFFGKTRRITSNGGIPLRERTRNLGWFGALRNPHTGDFNGE